MVYYIYIFFIGNAIGSYINNISYRIVEYMKNMTIYEAIKNSDYPKYSVCPECKIQLKWWMNIPLFSWIFLRGKCYYCNNTIPYIYFLSEIIFGIIIVVIYAITQSYILTLINFILFCILYLILLIQKLK